MNHPLNNFAANKQWPISESFADRIKWQKTQEEFLATMPNNRYNNQSVESMNQNDS